MNREAPRVLSARTCYGHIGGTLGGRLFERLLELGWLERDEGKSTVFVLTERGRRGLADLGVDIYERRR